MRIWKLAAVFFTLFILILLIYGYFQYRKSRSQAQQQRVARPRNIYIITASGLRPDHLSCYLYQHGQTPAIDFLAYDGVRFNNAYSASSDSLLAHLSLLTGHYSFTQPIRSVIDFLDFNQPRLPEVGVNLAEWTRAKGYRTAAFLSDPELRFPSFFGSMFTEIATGDSQLPSWQPAYSPAQTSQLARDWVLTHAQDTQFLLLNFSEPTLPFVPSTPYNRQYLNHPYDGEIAALDEQIGLFMHALKDSGLFQNSIVIFASPFGESLDQEIRTGSLTSASLRIPVFVAAPGILPVHQEYNQVASLVDIFPTIAALLEQPIDGQVDGLPLFKKGTSEEIDRETVFAESRVPSLFGFPTKYFITNGKSNFVTGEETAGHERLAQLLNERLKRADVLPARNRISTADVLPGPLLENTVLLARKGQPAHALDLLDSFGEELKGDPFLLALKAELSTASADLKRAKDLYEQAYRISHHPEILAGLSRVELKDQNYRRAYELQQQYGRLTNQVSYADYSTIGIALFHMQSYDQAIEAFDKALERNPRYTEAYLYRGMANQKQNKPGNAEADFKEAIELNPDAAMAYQQLALLLEHEKRPVEAIPYFRRFLERNPKDYGAMLELARLQEESGNSRAARKLAEQILIYAEDQQLKAKAKEIIAK